MNKTIEPTKTVVHSRGKVIDVYDGLFSHHEQIQFSDFIKKSFFKIDGYDQNALPLEMQLHSQYSFEDTLSMGFTSHPAYFALDEKYGLSGMEIVQSRVNLTTPSEKNRVHTDNTGITILYYANMEWDTSWGGHTLFMDDSLQDAEFTCLYKSGRVIVFDGSIPHMIMTPSNICPTYRTTFAIQYRSV